MMRVAIAFVVLACALVSAATVQCNRVGPVQTINVNSTFGGEFGCDKYSNSVKYNFVVKVDKPTTFTIQSLQTEQCCDKLSVMANGVTKQGPFSGTTPSANTFTYASGTVVTFAFSSDGSNTGNGFTIAMSEGPTTTQLLSGQMYNDRATQQGGFNFYELEGCGLASSVDFTINVLNYQGLRAPTLFVSNAAYPSLEDYGWRNESVMVNGNYQASIPINGGASTLKSTYVAGAFLYGTSTDLQIVGNYNYSTSAVPELSNNVPASGSVASSNDYYQIYLGPDVSSANFQISRHIPGGFPSLTIRAGILPCNGKFDKVLDTKQASYMSWTVKQPYDSTKPNPGLYLMQVSSDSSSSSGYIIGVSYNTLDGKQKAKQIVLP